MEAALNNSMSALYNQSMLNKSRKDKFLMVITPPVNLRDKITEFQRGNDKVNLNAFQFSVFGVVVPEVSIPQVEMNYGGQTLKVTSYTRPTYPDIDVDFTVDNNYNNYWFIYYWLKTLNDPRTALPANNTPSLLLDYSTTITVYGLDEYNNNKIKFEYSNAKPVRLGGINYNYRDSGEIQSSFTFSFFEFTASLL